MRQSLYRLWFGVIVLLSASADAPSHQTTASQNWRTGMEHGKMLYAVVRDTSSSFDISLIALPQLSQQLIVAPYCIFMLYVEISLLHHQFLSQKFGNFKGGGKFVVTITALIYAYGNLQIYNIIGLYAPYTNRVIFNKIRNNSLWHKLCILMIIYNLTQKHKKKFKFDNNFR